MIDMTQFASALTSLNAINTLLSSAIGVRDEAKRLTASGEALSKLAEAHGKLLSMQIAATDSNTQHESVLREKRDLEEKIRDLEHQKQDFERYDLHELSPGVLVYRLRPVEQSVEPMHFLCSRCRNEGKKSILARIETALKISHTCPSCEVDYLEKRIPKKPINPALLSGGVGWMAR